ncbi:MAG: AIR synthase-related protein [Chitinophagaceae bacterium]
MSSFDTSGKFQKAFFEEHLYPRFGLHRPEVSVGPAFGVDVAIIDLPDNKGLAITSDPLSLIPSLGYRESAWLSVQLLVNDMATTGFAPMYAQFVLNLPQSLNENGFKEYWNWINHYCIQTGVAITGGHTCKIEGQHSTIAGGGTMFLTAPRKEILTSKGAEPGDALVLLGEPACSSTAILSLSFPETIAEKSGKEVQQKGADLFSKTSVIDPALCAAAFNAQYPRAVKAMHDVTEGGVYGAVFEMAFASGTGVELYAEKMPEAPVQQEICALFNIDPCISIGAGAMVLAADPDYAGMLVKHLAEAGVTATIIGNFRSDQEGKWLETNGERIRLPYPEKDPYWNAFFTAMKNGWK